MKDSVNMTLLYDYYGQLLTAKQRECFDLYYNQDYSLAEIAAEVGISRQGVHDSIARAETMLRHMEEKLGCRCREEQLQKAMAVICDAAGQLSQSDDAKTRSLAGDILRAADTIKE